MRLPLLLSCLALSAAAGAARAEPAACSAPLPIQGEAFAGPVMQVIDGDRLCVALGPTPDQWVEVRPAGVVKVADAPETARSVMMAATFSKRLDCVAGAAAGHGVEAVCTVEGERLPEAVKAANASPGARLWR